ncbi:MAG: hypothetical protein QM675_07370 [Protaetiibacter sp.]
MTDAVAASATRRRRPGRGVVIVGAVLLSLGAGALAAIPFGGWDTVSLQSAVVPELPQGESYHGRHFSVRVEEAWVGDVLPDDYDEPEEGMTFVVVRAVVRNEWREADTRSAQLLTFDALEALPRVDRFASVRIAADGTFTSMLPPGVETEVLMRWEVPDGSVQVGEPIVFGVIDGVPEQAVLYSGTAWRDEKVVVQATRVPASSSELEYPWEQ